MQQRSQSSSKIPLPLIIICGTSSLYLTQIPLCMQHPSSFGMHRSLLARSFDACPSREPNGSSSDGHFSRDGRVTTENIGGYWGGVKMATSDIGTGKSVFVLAVVVGCFAILWPKIFYPMMQAAFSMTMPKPIDEARITPANCGMMFVRDMNKDPVFVQTCGLLIDNEDDFWVCVERLKKPGNYSEEDKCRKGIIQLCGFDLAVMANETAKAEPTEAWRLKEEMTRSIISCQRRHFPKRIKPRSKYGTPPKSEETTHEKRPDDAESPTSRPPHLHPGMMPPRVREAMGEARPEQMFGRADGRPFPHPSSRQPPKPQPKTGGAMSIIMPLYSLGMLIFFLYTIFKMAFKKNGESDKKPIVKDFHMDPEYRKLLLSEEYNEESSAESQEQTDHQHAKKNGQTTATNTMTVRESIENYGKDKDETNLSEKDYEIYRLRKRLEETEAAMSRIMKHMGIANDRMAAGILSRTGEAHPPSKSSPIIGTVPPFTKPPVNNKDIVELEQKPETSSPSVKNEEALSSSREGDEKEFHFAELKIASTSQQSSPDVESYELLNGLSAATTPSEERANELPVEDEKDWAAAPISVSTTFSSSSSFENIDNVKNISSENEESLPEPLPPPEESMASEANGMIDDNDTATSMHPTTNDTTNQCTESASEIAEEVEEEECSTLQNGSATHNDQHAEEVEVTQVDVAENAAKSDEATSNIEPDEISVKKISEVVDEDTNKPSISKDEEFEAESNDASQAIKPQEQRNSGHSSGSKRRKRHRHRASNKGNNSDIPNGTAKTGP